MGMQGACLITMGGDIRHDLLGTSSHMRLRSKWGLDDTNSVGAYYMPVRRCDIFKLDRYKLFLRDARYAIGDETAMHAASNAQRPGWLVDELWTACREEMATRVAEAFDDVQPVINSRVQMRGCDETHFPSVYVRDSATFRGAAIETMADDCWFHGWLDLRDTPMTTLPERLVVGGASFAAESPHPDVFNVERMPFTSWPESLVIGPNCIVKAEGSALTWDAIPRQYWARVEGLGPPPQN